MRLSSVGESVSSYRHSPVGCDYAGAIRSRCRCRFRHCPGGRRRDCSRTEGGSAWCQLAHLFVCVGEVLLVSDIHCQPNSGPEPFGIAFVEALNAGLPVVSTAAGGVLGIVDDTCGRLARPDDVDDIARHLCALVEEP